MHCIYALDPQRSEKGSESPRTEIAHGSEPPCVFGVMNLACAVKPHTLSPDRERILVFYK